ncbi:MAG: hypothetical protein C0434_08005 [Xanthomonadaceae bacterium]|nr:hypothetical protein [Xanthomonadaceae bacterium]
MVLANWSARAANRLGRRSSIPAAFPSASLCGNATAAAGSSTSPRTACTAGCARPRKSSDVPALDNARHERFAHEYIVDLNGKQAAIRAGYSPGAAEVTASKLVSNAKVAARIDELKAARLKRVDMDADATLKRIEDAVNADVADLYGEDLRMLHPRQMPKEVRALISSVEHFPNGKVKVKFIDKAKALEMLARHHNLFDAENKGKAAAMSEAMAGLIAAASEGGGLAGLLKR